MKTEPQKEHQWLQQLVGEWTSEADCAMGPGQPSTKSYGTERVRMVGGLWMVGEGQGEMPGGGTATMIMTLGYDPQKQKYLGTWIGSMMTHMWHYDGEMDASGRILTLSAEGPSMAGDGTMAQVPGHHRDQEQGPSHVVVARARAGRHLEPLHDGALPAQKVNR